MKNPKKKTKKKNRIFFSENFFSASKNRKLQIVWNAFCQSFVKIGAMFAEFVVASAGFAKRKQFVAKKDPINMKWVGVRTLFFSVSDGTLACWITCSMTFSVNFSSAQMEQNTRMTSTLTLNFNVVCQLPISQHLNVKLTITSLKALRLTSQPRLPSPMSSRTPTLLTSSPTARFTLPGRRMKLLALNWWGTSSSPSCVLPSSLLCFLVTSLWSS